MASLVGKTLKNRYRIEESLGRGGMAEVYKVWDTQRGVALAMKVLREDLAEDIVFLRRFEREAKNLTRLQHPNIVRCYGLEQEGRTAFMLMDYIEGGTLRSEIFDAHGPLALQRILEIMQPVCSALNYAHQMGMVHCDVKSANIMIHKNGTVYLGDFGIARGMDSATSTMVGIGTPAYMAPELIKGEDPTPQTDIYALGIVLYEMLTGGERPFTGERATITGTTAEKVRWEHLQLEPIPIAQFNQNISEKMEEIVMTCLAKNVENRYQAILDVSNALMKEYTQKFSSRPIPTYTSYVTDNEINTFNRQTDHETIKSLKEANQKNGFPIPILLGILGIIGGISIIIFSLSGDSKTTYSNTNNRREPTSVSIRPTSTSFPKEVIIVQPTATKVKQSCSGAPPQRLEVNEDAIVCTKSERVALRTGPSKNNAIIRYIDTGTKIWVLDGPECANDWSWWEVKLQNDTIGWMAEGGDSIDYYFLCPN